MTEPDFLICQPRGRGVIVVPGTAKRRCAKCERPVWVAPSGQRRLRTPTNVTIVCVPCGLKLAAEDPERKVMPITPEQLAEMNSTLRGN